MSDDLSAEFETYRMVLHTEEGRLAFDRKIKQLLQERGVDYVRGYVDGLRDNIPSKSAPLALDRTARQ